MPTGKYRVTINGFIVLGLPPLGLDEALAVEAMQGLVERGVFDRQVSARPLVNSGGHAVAVHGPGRQRPKHQQIERPLNEWQRWHVFP